MMNQIFKKDFFFFFFFFFFDGGEPCCASYNVYISLRNIELGLLESAIMFQSQSQNLF